MDGHHETIYPPAAPRRRDFKSLKLGPFADQYLDRDIKSLEQTVSISHNPFEGKWRAEAESSGGPSAYQPNALPPGQTGSLIDTATGSSVT